MLEPAQRVERGINARFRNMTDYMLALRYGSPCEADIVLVGEASNGK
jgi:hypothetical protein